MRILLSISGIIAGGFGLLMWGASKSSIHEILAAVLLLTGAVLFVGGAIISALEKIEQAARSVQTETEQVRRAVEKNT